MSRQIEFENPEGDSISPPKWLIEAVAGRQVYPRIRPFVGIADRPFPRPNGPIVEEPGYDWATANLLSPTFDFVRLSQCPSHEDAQAAWLNIREDFCDFPFGSEITITVPRTPHVLSAEFGRMNAPRLLRAVAGDLDATVMVDRVFIPRFARR